MIDPKIWKVAVFVVAFALQAGAQITNTNPPVRLPAGSNTPPTMVLDANQTSPELTNNPEAQAALSNQFGIFPTSPSPVGPTPVGSPQAASPIMGTSALTTGPGFGAIPSGPPLPLWGPISIRPHAFYSVTYGNGLQATPGHQQKIVVNTFSPGFTLELGKNWSLDYNPSFAFYANSHFQDTIDHMVTLNGHWSNQDWTLGLSQSYASSDQPLIETGAQTAQQAYITAITAMHQLDDHFSVDLSLNQNFRNAQALTDLKEWSTGDWLNYQINRAWGIGVGVTVGYDKVDPGSDMPFEELQGRVSYKPGTRLTITASGGVQDRQFLGPSAPPLISPLYSGLIQYQLFKPTVISVSASQTVTPSFYANEVEVATSVSGGISQQISKKLSLTVSAGYASTPLTSIAPEKLPPFFFGQPPPSTLTEVRSDSTTSFNLSLSYYPVQRFSASVFYSRSQNSSSQGNFAYSSTQVGLSLSYRY